jgi:hypothetical protein
MSRAELLDKLAAFNNLGGQFKTGNGRVSSTSGENDDDEDDGNESTASTVRNVVLVPIFIELFYIRHLCSVKMCLSWQAFSVLTYSRAHFTAPLTRVGSRPCLQTLE